MTSPEAGASPSVKPAQIDHEDLTLNKRPYRLSTLAWNEIVSHRYQGNGNDEDPFVVDFLPEIDNSRTSHIGADAEHESKDGTPRSQLTRHRDMENPMHWSEGYKWCITVVMAIATLAVSMASSTLSGATISIEESFPGYPTQAYVMVTSGFVLGFVVGPLLWGPLSEVYGRRNLFIFSYVLFTVFNGGVIASQNIWTLIILRFFAGMAGSSPLTNAGGVVADIFPTRQRGLGMAIFASAPFLGPAIGPIIGGFLGSVGWRWVAALIALFTLVITIVGTLIIPETYAPVLLRARAERLSKATGQVYRSRFEKDKQLAISQLFSTALKRPWVLLFREPIVFLLSLYMAIVYGTLYMLFGAFPIVFEENRGWSPGVSGLAFLGVLVGFTCAILYTIFVENPRYSRRLDKEGWLPPEQRLPPAIIGGFLLPIGLFSFSWTAAPTSINFMAPICLSAPFGMGMVLVFLSVFNYLIDSYLLYAASVLAANSVLRSLFGVGFPLFVTAMYHNLGINWASTLVSFLALACAPMPIIFFRYGEKVRTKSKYAREADALGQKMRQAAQTRRLDA